MGRYETFVFGDAMINGAVPDALLEKYEPGDEGEHFVLYESGTPDSVALVNGRVTIIPGSPTTQVRFRFEESITDVEAFTEACYTLMKEVRGCDLEIVGDFHAQGSESGDVWRMRFGGTEVFLEVARRVWPGMAGYEQAEGMD